MEHRPHGAGEKCKLSGGQIAWHGAFSTKWKASEHMNNLGIAGDYLLGRRVWLTAFPLDSGEQSEIAIYAAHLGRLRVTLVMLLKQVWVDKIRCGLMGKE